jgi:hypothetical protein
MRYRRVSSGSPIKPTAAEWNAVLDAAEAHDRARFDSTLPAGIVIRDRDRIRVKNGTNVDMPRGHCVKLLDPIIPPTTNLEEFLANPTLEANTPDANSRGQWAVLAEPIPALLYGWAWVAGIHAAQVRVLDPSHLYVDAIPATGSTIYLATDTAGSARILWRESGTGTRWALLRLGSPAPSAAIHAITPVGGIGAAFFVSGVRRCPWANCEIYRFDPNANNELTATGTTARVNNSSRGPIPGGVLIQAKQIGGHYFVDVEDCP